MKSVFGATVLLVCATAVPLTHIHPKSHHSGDDATKERCERYASSDWMYKEGADQLEAAMCKMMQPHHEDGSSLLEAGAEATTGIIIPWGGSTGLGSNRISLPIGTSADYDDTTNFPGDQQLRSSFDTHGHRFKVEKLERNVSPNPYTMASHRFQFDWPTWGTDVTDLMTEIKDMQMVDLANIKAYNNYKHTNEDNPPVQNKLRTKAEASSTDKSQRPRIKALLVSTAAKTNELVTDYEKYTELIYTPYVTELARLKKAAYDQQDAILGKMRVLFTAMKPHLINTLMKDAPKPTGAQVGWKLTDLVLLEDIFGRKASDGKGKGFGIGLGMVDRYAKPTEYPSNRDSEEGCPEPAVEGAVRKLHIDTVTANQIARFKKCIEDKGCTVGSSETYDQTKIDAILGLTKNGAGDFGELYNIWMPIKKMCGQPLGMYGLPDAEYPINVITGDQRDASNGKFKYPMVMSEMNQGDLVWFKTAETWHSAMPGMINTACDEICRNSLEYRFVPFWTLHEEECDNPTGEKTGFCVPPGTCANMGQKTVSSPTGCNSQPGFGECCGGITHNDGTFFTAVDLNELDVINE